jgi:shikimate dehydrogenase
MMNHLTGSTKVLAVIGHPVQHSLSPAMQNAAIAARGLDYIYVPFDVPPDQLSIAINGMRSLGVAGFNVTIPHKTAVIDCIDQLDETAISAGAVNTVKNDAGKLIGYNTDGDGLVRSLSVDLDYTPDSGEVVIIGAGGAARGALAALCSSGAKRIVIVSLSKEKGEALAQFMNNTHRNSAITSVGSMSELPLLLLNASLLINTTPLGMNNEPIPFLHINDLSATAKVYDMVYSVPVTQLIAEARKRGLVCANGLGMLAAQGELAFRIWTGLDAPSGVMKNVLMEVSGS